MVDVKTAGEDEKEQEPRFIHLLLVGKNSLQAVQTTDSKVCTSGEV